MHEKDNFTIALIYSGFFLYSIGIWIVGFFIGKLSSKEAKLPSLRDSFDLDCELGRTRSLPPQPYRTFSNNRHSQSWSSPERGSTSEEEEDLESPSSWNRHNSNRSNINNRSNENYGETIISFQTKQRQESYSNGGGGGGFSKPRAPTHAPIYGSGPIGGNVGSGINARQQARSSNKQ